MDGLVDKWMMEIQYNTIWALSHYPENSIVSVQKLKKPSQ